MPEVFAGDGSAYTHLKTNIPQTMAIASPPQSGVLNAHNQMRKIKPLPSRVINNRSPRVVSILNIPRRGLPPGLNFSHTPIPIKQVNMNRKNAAVGQVHAIQVKSMVYTLPNAKPFAM